MIRQIVFNNKKALVLLLSKLSTHPSVHTFCDNPMQQFYNVVKVYVIVQSQL